MIIMFTPEQEHTIRERTRAHMISEQAADCEWSGYTIEIGVWIFGPEAELVLGNNRFDLGSVQVQYELPDQSADSPP